MSTNKSTTRTVLAVILACLGINLGIGALIAVNRPAYLADYRLSTNPDAKQYVLLGRNLLLHGHYSRCQQPPYLPDMMRTPVYPLFAGGLDIVGKAGAIYLVQAVLHAAG
ncbi:MAG: hypothetical protein ABIH46_02030, partial [Chloroflexota bacterium]